MILTLFRVIICAISFLYTFYVLWNLTYFFSKTNETISYESEQGKYSIIEYNRKILLNLGV
jgi:membrane associated rhomboid family serine protease